MSLNNESSDSSDGESFQSSRSKIFSSGRSSSPAWSRSSSMTSGISARSVASLESRRKLKAMFGPISRPTATELLKYTDPREVQQQNRQESSTKVVQMKNKKKSFLPVHSKTVRPPSNIPQTQGWVTAYSGPMYGPLVYHCPPPMYYYPPPPPVQVPMASTCICPMPMLYSVPMLPPPMPPPMYSQPQVPHVSVQALQGHYTCTTWTYIDYA